MKNLFFILIAFSFLTACNTSPNENSTSTNGTATSVSSKTGFNKSIPTAEFKKLIDANAGILIDVRTPREFASSHIKGAININGSDSNFKNNINKLDKSKTYMVYCRSGARSGRAMSKMKKNGFQKTYNLSGGILGWQRSGFPVGK